MFRKLNKYNSFSSTLREMSNFLKNEKESNYKIIHIYDARLYVLYAYLSGASGNDFYKFSSYQIHNTIDIGTEFK